MIKSTLYLTYLNLNISNNLSKIPIKFWIKSKYDFMISKQYSYESITTIKNERVVEPTTSQLHYRDGHFPSRWLHRQDLSSPSLLVQRWLCANASCTFNDCTIKSAS